MSILALRDYQRETIEAIQSEWGRGIRRTAAVLPTGAGKTVVFAHVAAIMRDRGVRTLILAHRDELMEQAAAKVRAVAPALRVGIVKAERREIRNRDVVVASIQSLTRPARRAELAEAGLRLVIVDECHHATANTYVDTLRAMGCFEADPLAGAYALGVTATMDRADRVALGQVWETVAYRRDIVTMIRAGYLVNVKGVRVRVEGLDLTRVKRAKGDYADGALSEALHDALAPAATARAYVEHAKGRLGIAFWPTVALAHEGAEAFIEAGIPSAALSGTTPMAERRQILADFAAGRVEVVHNCAVLTEGFDAPWCSAVVIARPTGSAPLYVQMAGRGLRPHPGKRDALLLDVVGVTGKHKLAGMVNLAGAERVEELSAELAEFESDAEIDLLGMLDEPGSGGARPARELADGELVAEVVELFGASRHAWLRTRRGVWFLQSGDSLTFLCPGEPGRYWVARCPVRASGGEWLDQDLDLEMALSWGEQRAAEAAGFDGGMLTKRSARWRAGEPTSKQLAMAAQLGLNAAELTTKGDVSDAISVALASTRLDSMPCVASVSQVSYW